MIHIPVMLAYKVISALLRDDGAGSPTGQGRPAAATKPPAAGTTASSATTSKK
jgi:hypothetical protein